jgi:hypothetical protein
MSTIMNEQLWETYGKMLCHNKLRGSAMVRKSYGCGTKKRHKLCVKMYNDMKIVCNALDICMQDVYPGEQMFINNTPILEVFYHTGILEPIEDEVDIPLYTVFWLHTLQHLIDVVLPLVWKGIGVDSMNSIRLKNSLAKALKQWL